MRKTLQQLADRASNALGIDIEVTGNRAYHYASETRSAYWLTRADLSYAVQCAQSEPEDAYSHWCAGSGKPMSLRHERALGLTR